MTAFYSRVAPRWADALAVVALAAYAAVLLRKTLFGGGALVGYDLFNYFFPAKTFAAAALREGRLPLWNPDIFFGAPFLANIQMAALYPPDVVFGVLDFPPAVVLSQWFHLAVAGCGMFALARWGWGVGPVGALAGGVVFTGSGFFAAHMGHLNQVHAAAWMPWVALCLWRAGAPGRMQNAKCKMQNGRDAARLAPRWGWVGCRVQWVCAGGVAVALQVMAGHTQEAYYSLFSLGLLAVGFTLFPPARGPDRRRALPAYALICANGGLLAAAQLLPTLELTRLSYRQGGIPLEEAVAYGVERTNILETVLPTFWSLPSQEVTGYVGVAALALAAAAVAASPARRTALALVCLTLMALTLSMGGYTPLYALLHRFVPLFGSFRAPGRWVMVSTFALAGLAALGTDALRWRPVAAVRERAALRLGLALTALIAVLTLADWRTYAVHAIQWLPHARVAVLWLLAGMGASALALTSLFLRRPWASLALVGVMALELGFAAHEAEYNQPGDPALYRESPAIAGYLRGQADGLGERPRTLSLAVEERLDAGRFGRAVPAGDPEYKRYASMREALKPDLGMVYRLPSIDGYDGGLLPTRDYARFKALLVTQEPPVPHLTLGSQMFGRADAGMMAAFGVRTLLTDGRNGAPGEGWLLRESAPGAAWVYENASPGASRALLVDNVEEQPDPDAALVRLLRRDLRSAAVVQSHVAISGTAPTGFSDSARIVHDAPEEVVIETSVSAPRLLVLADADYPGWRVTIDGRPGTIVRADTLFRAVAVPAGTHRVRFWFDPLSVKLGLVVSALALIGNAIALWSWRRAWRAAV